LTTEAVSLFLALLAVVAELSVVVAVVLAAAGRGTGPLAGWRRSLADTVGDQTVALALAVAAVAMLGSLYYSEVAHFVPCRLCWYQRILMYPLVPVLGLAAWRRDDAIRPYGMLLAGIGAVVSSYHVLVERFPTLESSVCEPANPCTLIWVRELGYLTIPTMALSGFALIFTLLAVRKDVA
jgi:disulfide bond formation protein DsbB